MDVKELLHSYHEDATQYANQILDIKLGSQKLAEEKYFIDNPVKSSRELAGRKNSVGKSNFIVNEEQPVGMNSMTYSPEPMSNEKSSHIGEQEIDPVIVLHSEESQTELKFPADQAVDPNFESNSASPMSYVSDDNYDNSNKPEDQTALRNKISLGSSLNQLDEKNKSIAQSTNTAPKIVSLIQDVASEKHEPSNSSPIGPVSPLSDYETNLDHISKEDTKDAVLLQQDDIIRDISKENQYFKKRIEILEESFNKLTQSNKEDYQLTERKELNSSPMQESMEGQEGEEKEHYSEDEEIENFIHKVIVEKSENRNETVNQDMIQKIDVEINSLIKENIRWREKSESLKRENEELNSKLKANEDYYYMTLNKLKKDTEEYLNESRENKSLLEDYQRQWKEVGGVKADHPLSFLNFIRNVLEKCQDLEMINKTLSEELSFSKTLLNDRTNDRNKFQESQVENNAIMIQLSSQIEKIKSENEKKIGKMNKEIRRLRTEKVNLQSQLDKSVKSCLLLENSLKRISEAYSAIFN